MKTLVAYISRTGNTKKVAQAIHDEVPGEKDLMPICDVPDSSTYDLIFLGFPVHQFGPDRKAVMRMQQHCVPGRKVALFITHAAPEGTPELQDWLAKFREAASGAEILGIFDCQGQLATPVKMMLRLSPNKRLRDWAKNDNSKGQPDEERLRRAREFAREVMRKAGHPS